MYFNNSQQCTSIKIDMNEVPNLIAAVKQGSFIRLPPIQPIPASKSQLKVNQKTLDKGSKEFLVVDPKVIHETRSWKICHLISSFRQNWLLPRHTPDHSHNTSTACHSPLNYSRRTPMSPKNEELQWHHDTNKERDSNDTVRPSVKSDKCEEAHETESRDEHAEARDSGR